MDLRSLSGAVGTELRPGATRHLSLTWLALLATGLLVAVATPRPEERELLAAVTADRPAALVDAARAATMLGDLRITVLLAGLVLAALWRYTAAARWLAVITAVSFFGSTLVIGVLKVLTDRDRPDGGLVDTFSSTFPSGHAGRAAAVYGLLVWAAYRYVRPAPLRVALVGVALGLVCAIALSRIYLGVHWPSDVLTGFLLGSLWATAVVHHVRPPGARPAPAPHP